MIMMLMVRRRARIMEMVLSTFMRKKDCKQLKKELLCEGGIAESGLQVVHVQVLLVAPLGACDMAQAGADEHQGGVAIREGTHNSGAPADLAVETFHDVVRADPRPVLGWEIAVGQRLLNAVF